MNLSQVLISYYYSCLAKFYDLKNHIEIQCVDYDYKHTNFLKNGNFVTFTCNKNISTYPIILIYSFSNSECKSKAVYKFNVKDINFGGAINDKMWMTADDFIFLLDLSTFQLQKLSIYVSKLLFYNIKILLLLSS